MSRRHRKKKKSLNAFENGLERGNLRKKNVNGERIFISIEDAAHCFGESKGTILKWVRSGKIPAHPLDGRIYLHREEIKAALGIGTES